MARSEPVPVVFRVERGLIGEQNRSWVDPNVGASSNDGAENASLAAPNNDNRPGRHAAGYYDTTTKLLTFGTRSCLPQLARWTQMDRVRHQVMPRPPSAPTCTPAKIP